MNRIKRRIDLYVHFLCGRVALLLDFHSSPYKISLGPSLYSCRQILMEVRSQIDECARWLGRVRNRRSNGWYRSIPCRVMCCRLDEMTFFLCQSPICLFTGIDIPIWTLAVVAAAAASIGYYMTTREFEKKSLNEEVELLLPSRVCSTVRIVHVYTSRNWNPGMKRIYCISSGCLFYFFYRR